MSTSNDAIAVANPSQGLTVPASTAVQSPGAAPLVTADQASIASVPTATPPAKTVDPKELREELARVKSELPVVTKKNEDLTTRLSQIEPVAQKIEELGGIEYVEQATKAANLYNDLALEPLAPNGEITLKHYKIAEKFVDAIHDLSPVGGDRMQIVMDNHYGALAWDKFAKWLFDVEKPSNDLVAAAKWGIDQFRLNGNRVPDLQALANQNANGKALPPYCYDYDGNEIPEIAASVRAERARTKALEDRLNNLETKDKTKTEAQLRAEEAAKVTQQQERVAKYREQAFQPVEDAIKKNIPDWETNSKTDYIRSFLRDIAEKKAGNTLQVALKDAEAGNKRAESALGGIRAKVLIAIVDALPLALSYLGEVAKAPTQEQIDKVKEADGSAAPKVADAGAIPYRPERSDFDNDQAWIKETTKHNELYRGRFKSYGEYIKATTRSSAA